MFKTMVLGSFLVGSVIGIQVQSIVDKYRFDDRLKIINENVAQYVHNQQLINSVYEPAITSLVLKSRR